MIGITAIVLSLLFVGFQLRQSQQMAVEELVNNSNERQNAIRELIVANADIWHQACAGEPLDPASRVVAAKIFEAYMDHVVGEYILRRVGVRQSDESRQKIIEEIAAQFWIYPGLGELAESRRNWDNGAVETSTTSGEFFARIRNRVEELESSGVEPERDTAWCGRT